MTPESENMLGSFPNHMYIISQWQGDSLFRFFYFHFFLRSCMPTSRQYFRTAVLSDLHGSRLCRLLLIFLNFLRAVWASSAGSVSSISSMHPSAGSIPNSSAPSISAWFNNSLPTDIFDDAHCQKFSFRYFSDTGFT